MSFCKQCHQNAKIEHRYEVIEYPYNPEWQVSRLDAGVFCSSDHLVDYLVALRVVGVR